MLRRVGIAGRTAALLTVVAAAAFALGGLWLSRRQATTERALLEARAAALASAIEATLAEAMGEHRPESMRAVVAAVGGTQDVAAVAVAGRGGEVRYRAGTAPDVVPVPERPRFSWSERAVDRVAPLANLPSCQRCHGSEARRNGAVLVSLDTTRLGPRLASQARQVALLAAAALLLTAAAVALVLRSAVARPLASLRGFAESMTRGELSARPPVHRAHEIGGLAEALRRMAEEVQRSHDALERRVAERTSRLAEALGAAEAAREERSAALTRLQAIVDSMADGVIYVDAEGRIALVNEAARQVPSLDDAVGRPLGDSHPLASHGVLERMMRWRAQGDDTGPAHSIIQEKEGRFETTYAPVRAPGGAFLGVVMVTRDIAERRSLERRLLDAERLAGLGQMSAQVAHELRNPLNAIGGAAQYLRRVLPDHAEVQEYAALIGDEVQRVSRFVDDLLHVSRPTKPVLVPSALNRLIGEATRRVALARGLPDGAIRLELERNLPVLDLDPAMAMEAVVNLLDNALDAGGGPPEIASYFEAPGGQGIVVVEVRDRGCGIAPEMIEEVTRPFVTTKAAGTGLGLVVVTRAMDQHRARFRLFAREGGGTVARLEFAVRTVRAAAEAAEITS